MEFRTAARLPDRGINPSTVVVGIVADDYPTLRRTALVLGGTGFEIAALACDIGEVIVEAAGEELDVIVLNPAGAVQELPAQITALRRRLGDVGVVVVMRSVKPRDLRRALDAGVDGIVLESQLRLVLPLTVRTVSAGQLSLPDQARAHVHREVLSYRERQVLAGVSEGLTNR